MISTYLSITCYLHTFVTSRHVRFYTGRILHAGLLFGVFFCRGTFLVKDLKTSSITDLQYFVSFYINSLRHEPDSIYSIRRLTWKLKSKPEVKEWKQLNMIGQLPNRHSASWWTLRWSEGDVVIKAAIGQSSVVNLPLIQVSTGDRTQVGSCRRRLAV